MSSTERTLIVAGGLKKISRARWMMRLWSFPAILGHSEYQTTAYVYTHLRDEMLGSGIVNMEEVFRSRGEVEGEEFCSKPIR